MPDDKTFTREQVSALMKKRVERSHQSFFKRYGVKDLSELDALFEKANSLEGLQSQLTEKDSRISELEGQNRDLTKKYALKAKNINPDKIADVEAHFKGKGIDIDETSLETELGAHSDWVLKQPTIREVGPTEEGGADTDAQEKALASQIFGVSF